MKSIFFILFSLLCCSVPNLAAAEELSPQAEELLHAIEGGNLPQVKQVDLKQLDHAELSLGLRESIDNSYFEICKYLLRSHAFLPSDLGLALFSAVSLRKEKFAALLLNKHNAPVDFVAGGLTALMKAAMMGDRSLVELLLKSGANTSLRNSLGYSAFDFAVIRERKHLLLIPGFAPKSRKTPQKLSAPAFDFYSWLPSWESTVGAVVAVSAIYVARVFVERGYLARREAFVAAQDQLHGRCSICLEGFVTATVQGVVTSFGSLACGHKFHEACLTELVKTIFPQILDFGGTYALFMEFARSLPTSLLLKTPLEQLALGFAFFRQLQGGNPQVLQRFVETMIKGVWMGQQLVCPTCRAPIDPGMYRVRTRP